MSIYGRGLADTPLARSCLQHWGISDGCVLERHRIGYCTGGLTDLLPNVDDDSTRADLVALGVISGGGRERFAGHLIFPVVDLNGHIETLWACRASRRSRRQFCLPNSPPALWNTAACRANLELLCVPSVVDALCLEMAGYRNVIAFGGPAGDRLAGFQMLAANGVGEVTVVLTGADKSGDLRGLLGPAPAVPLCYVATLPRGLEFNRILVRDGATALREAISQVLSGRELVTDSGATRSGPAGPSGGTRILDTREVGRAEQFAICMGVLNVMVLGLNRAISGLKATVRIQHGGRLHVDTLDLYSARARRNLCQDICRVFGLAAGAVEVDMARLVLACERHQPTAALPKASQTPPMTSAEEQQAEAFGRKPDLVERILADFETCGLLGERHNKLLCYLAAVSRKMDEPLSVLILSSSGAGKTALQDATLRFCPPEDVVKLTTLTGKALFYKEELSLRHRVLALEEAAGAEEAGYAIRNLISAGELTVEATVKDSLSGRLTTMQNRVRGPTAVLYTMTNPRVDPETRSRFFVIGIDESREQTGRILEFQRQSQGLDGLARTSAIAGLLSTHRNFQRLLRPLAVVNPYAESLTYTDDRLQARRGQRQYLNLVRAVAFLRQMQKPVKTHAGVEYIEADLEDATAACTLASEILGHSLDELSIPSRSLLLLLAEMVGAARRSPGAESPGSPADGFTRRQIREFSGWSSYRVHTHLKELVEFEYVAVESARNGSVHRYRLAYDGQGQNGGRFLLGVRGPEPLGA
jgi:hypothetical protein